MKIKKLMIVKYVFEMMLLIMLSFMYYLNKPIETPRVLYIHKGSITKIITQLQAKHYDVSGLDIFFLRLIGSPQSGWVDMQKTSSTKADFLYKLTTAKAALQNVTLIPGETTYIFLEQLAESLHLNIVTLHNVYRTYAKHKEGMFVPDTYKVPRHIKEKDLILLLLKVSHAKMKSFSLKVFGVYNEKKWFQYISIASIIQKEAANAEEMPLVSSVIYNRIKAGMKLQMDGTLNYGKYSHIRVTPYRIKHDASSYNTYKHKGIPAVPVSNVGFDAIKAAIFPAKTKYLYFMKNKRGTHNFACNYSTHLYNIRYVTKRNK